MQDFEMRCFFIPFVHANMKPKITQGLVTNQNNTKIKQNHQYTHKNIYNDL